MEVNESLVSTLLSMGFPDEGDIREALRIAKNDVSEAISVLVNDTRPAENVNNSTGFPCDLSSPSMAVVPMVTSTTAVDGGDPGASPCVGEEMHIDEPAAAAAGFPLAALLELEGRTFTEKWSIPFKQHESLCVCMQACTRLARDQLLEAEENATRFINRALPECFQKLLNSSQVNTWMHDIQEGIFDMLNFLIELIAERLGYTPMCCQLMELLALALNPQTEYHKRHKAKKTDKNFWKDKLRESLNSERLFSSSSNLNLHRDPYGYLCHLINKFASCKGFERLRNLCSAPDATVNDLAYALFPFGLCAEQVSTDTFQDYLKAACERALTMCTNLGKDDLKRRDLRVFQLLSGVRLLYLRFRDKEVSACDQARTNLVQAMLGSGRFNSRMNGLKELGCMMATAKDPSSAKKRQSIGLEPLLQWMQEKEVLSLALGDGHSLDNMQMCDGVKEIVEFIGAKLSVSDVTKLWHMAHSSPALFPVLAAAASRLPEDTLGHLLQLVQADWKAAKGRSDNWSKLVELVGLAAKEKALQILWEMAHESGLGRQQIDCVLQQHLALLKDYAKDNLRRQYLTKCVANIKAKQLVYPSVSYLYQLCSSLSNGYKNDAKNTLNEWNQGHELVLVLVTSIKDHQRDCYKQFGQHLCAISSLDGNYTHEEYLRLHLDLIHYILRNADLYLTKIRVLEMWTALISGDSSTETDRDAFFNWLVRSFDDLEDKTRKELFENHFLQLDIAKVTPNGFSCFKYFFERINQAAGNLTIVQPTSFNSERKLTVEKLELFGSSYLWSLYLRSDRPAVFRAALDCLMDCYYRCVSIRLKAGSAANDLHKRFLNDCFGHLNDSGSKGTSGVLRLLEFYLQTAESDYQHKRLRPLHCATYPGEEMQLRVDCDRPKRAAFQLAVHSHLTFGKLREELAIALNCDSASRRCARMAASVPARLRPDPTQPDKPIDAHARLADVKSPSSDACSALERALPSNLLADDSRTYPLLKRCLRQGVYEAAAVLDLLPTCPDPVLADDLSADSPLLTYSLQCLFSMPECAEQHATRLVQLAPERLTPRQLYLVGHLVSKSVSACDPQQQRLPDGLAAHLLACAASLRDTREPVGQAPACAILLNTLFGLPGFRPADVVSLSGFQSALLDLLVACPSQRVRQTLSQLLLQRVATPDCPELVPTLHSLLEGLPLPYWHSSVTGVRQASLHLLCNCAERVASVEQDWLTGFQLSQTAACQCQQEEDALLAGHLRLLAAAWQADPPDPSAGERLLPQLIGAFLMPADSHCRAGPLSRPAIYDLLLQLCASNCRCLRALSLALRPLHRIHGWEVPAPPEPRGQCGLVGLKNGGATCYMNSVLQQLFMVPGLAAAVLSTPDPTATAGDEQNTATAATTVATAASGSSVDGGGSSESGDGALYQLQLVLAHLLELQQQYYVPDQLWANFSLWGEKVNPREQQDAFAFFQALIDQTDEQAKRPLLSAFFRGRFKHLIESEQCEHRCELEEDFYGLHLPVQSGSLEAALHAFVRGETMQADNAYSCERCGNRKVTALRRTRIASLPPVLCFHLKRFDYDWLRGQPLKSDLYFSFPRRVELGPFMASAAGASSGDSASDGPQQQQQKEQEMQEQQQPSNYNLVGVVIHSGKASAGHYYSLVRERRPGELG
uniref:ubiquitinyl hydrolase 1 n=2 Tax=Macrostomum lignano TaxID=282301 RepID=A0A1I8IA36_9PLAT